MMQAILRLRAVQQATGYSRSTIYLRIKQGLWPRQVALGPRCIGWPQQEVFALNEARVEGKSDDDIRTLVAHLHQARQSGKRGQP